MEKQNIMKKWSLFCAKNKSWTKSTEQSIKLNKKWTLFADFMNSKRLSNPAEFLKVIFNTFFSGSKLVLLVDIFDLTESFRVAMNWLKVDKDIFQREGSLKQGFWQL